MIRKCVLKSNDDVICHKYSMYSMLPSCQLLYSYKINYNYGNKFIFFLNNNKKHGVIYVGRKLLLKTK